MVEEFCHVYLCLCKDNHADPQNVVLAQIKAAQLCTLKGGSLLNLSTHCLSANACCLLAKALSTDRAFTEVRANDCMLPEDGVRALAQGLAENQVCKKLELKGNNIRGAAVECLGRMLRRNKRLISLCLEWNCVGMLETPFGVFCEGLGTNTRLQLLDLRNNQITHTGAQELCAALKRNMTLRVLDLRWNNLGLMGGRAMLCALTQNKTLVKLELAGNNIPNDVMCAIEKSVDHNSEKDALMNDCSVRQKMLTREIQVLKKEKAEEIAGMLDRMDHHEVALTNSRKSQQCRITQLHMALEDRKAQFNDMAAKLSLAESELAMAETKITELESLMQKARDDQLEMANFHQGELRREREDRTVTESRLNKEIMSLNEQNLTLHGANAMLEAKVRAQQEQIYQLKEQLTHSAADSKLIAAQCEERIEAEKHKTKEACREANDMKNKEITRVRQEADKAEHLLKEHATRVEQHRMEQEQEMARLRNQIAEEKLASEEHLMMTKQHIKLEEDQRRRQMEEKIRLLQISKDDLQQHTTHVSANVTELQTKNSNLALEVERLKHKVEDKQHELAGKDNELLTETGKVRIEMKARITKLEGERQTHSELYTTINTLERQLSEMTEKHSQLSNETSAKISQMADQLRQRESLISQMKAEDANRACILTNAIQTYVAKSPFSA